MAALRPPVRMHVPNERLEQLARPRGVYSDPEVMGMARELLNLREIVRAAEEVIDRNSAAVTELRAGPQDVELERHSC